jgi:trk system potassium uptake protein TrkA
MNSRFIVMGAGEVGYLLAQRLSHAQHDVTIIDTDPEKRRIEDELDVAFVNGNAAQVPVLKAANVEGCDLFIATSSSEEANLAASLLAKDMGAQRTVVRVATNEDLTIHRRRYERLFQADLLLSPTTLATNRILNHVLGHNTDDIDYLAQGRIQLRQMVVQPGSVLINRPLSQVKMPKNSRIVGFIDEHERLEPPTGEHVATSGERAVVVCSSDSIEEIERLFGSSLKTPGAVVIAGGASMGATIASALTGQVKQIKLIERDRRRARHLANLYPAVEIIHGDATDPMLLRAENIGSAHTFIGATGHDDSNLMAGLEAEELGVQSIVVLVDRSETSRLWQRIGNILPISARSLAAARIGDYITNGYKENLVTVADGSVTVIRRTVFEESPVAGASLIDISPPTGLIVGAVIRGPRVFMPKPTDTLHAGDQVLLFVHRSQNATVQLFFPGLEAA